MAGEKTNAKTGEDGHQSNEAAESGAGCPKGAMTGVQQAGVVRQGRYLQTRNRRRRNGAAIEQEVTIVRHQQVQIMISTRRRWNGKRPKQAVWACGSAPRGHRMVRPVPRSPDLLSTRKIRRECERYQHYEAWAQELQACGVWYSWMEPYHSILCSTYQGGNMEHPSKPAQWSGQDYQRACASRFISRGWQHLPCWCQPKAEWQADFPPRPIRQGGAPSASTTCRNGGNKRAPRNANPPLVPSPTATAAEAAATTTTATPATGDGWAPAASRPSSLEPGDAAREKLAVCPAK